MKIFEMKEFLSIYELNFIKWNADIMKITKVFHVKKLLYFKI